MVMVHRSLPHSRSDIVTNGRRFYIQCSKLVLKYLHASSTYYTWFIYDLDLCPRGTAGTLFSAGYLVCISTFGRDTQENKREMTVVFCSELDQEGLG